MTPTQSIDPTQFQTVHNMIRPKPEELEWTKIMWEPDLWEGRIKAAKQNRPMFIWAMNGNPLGCV